MDKFPILFEGSVKNIRGEEGKSPYIFEFSDSYSVFDWGKMPDELKDKGKSLAFMSNLFFELLGDSSIWKNWNPPLPVVERFEDIGLLENLKKDGAVHHSLGLVDKEANKMKNEEISNYLAVAPVKILHPTLKEKDSLRWDYSVYESKPINALVPLEVIFRFSIPTGSSLLERTNNIAYCQELGIKKEPLVGDKFDLPIIEFSTKLETKDSYIPYRKAREIACLTDGEFNRLYDLAMLLALRLKDIFNEVNIDLLDGKFEFAFSTALAGGEREITIVDAIGPDELRLSYKGTQLSKEILRKFYRKTRWYKAVNQAKELSVERGEKDWKKICLTEIQSFPSPLDRTLKENVSMMYKTLANILAKNFLSVDIFNNVLELDQLIENF